MSVGLPKGDFFTSIEPLLYASAVQPNEKLVLMEKLETVDNPLAKIEGWVQAASTSKDSVASAQTSPTEKTFAGDDK